MARQFNYPPSGHHNCGSHLLQLHLDHSFIFPYRRDLLSQQSFVSDGESYHLCALRLSCSTTKHQNYRLYDDRWLCLLTGPQDRELIRACSQSYSLNSHFLYPLFDIQGLASNDQGYRICLASALIRTGKAAAVQGRTVSSMIATMELQRPRVTPVLPQWDLGIVLEALSKPS